MMGGLARHGGSARMAGTMGWHGEPARMARGLAPSAQHGLLLLGRADPTCYSTRLCQPNQSIFRPSHRPKWTS